MTFVSSYSCEDMETICLSLGGIVISSRAQIGSMTLVYLWSAVFNCMEKNGKFKIPCRMSNMVLFRCRNERPMSGLVSFSITMKISWKSMSPTSNLSSTVLYGFSSCPLATIIWKLGAGPSLIMD